MGSTANTIGITQSTSQVTAGANSPIEKNSNNVTTTTKFGNNTTINPDSSNLTAAALTSLGNALQTAVSNRDVIAPAGSVATQVGTQNATTGLVDSVTGFFSSPGIKLAFILAFPILGGLLWLLFRKKKN